MYVILHHGQTGDTQKVRRTPFLRRLATGAVLRIVHFPRILLVRILFAHCWDYCRRNHSRLLSNRLFRPVDSGEGFSRPFQISQLGRRMLGCHEGHTTPRFHWKLDHFLGDELLPFVVPLKNSYFVVELKVDRQLHSTTDAEASAQQQTHQDSILRPTIQS